MEKVKVWGLEIDSCWKCYHHGYTDFDELCCSYTGTVIKSDINEDCPFSKPVTGELIESYGFKKHNNGGFYKDNYRLWLLGDNTLLIYKDIEETFEDTCDVRKLVFGAKDVVNNPVELEFILKSIGVIE